MDEYKVSPELIKNYINTLGPEKPYFVRDILVNDTELKGENSFVITIELTEDIKNRLDIDEPIFLDNMFRMLRPYLANEKAKELLTYATKINFMSLDLNRYFPIRRMVFEFV